jgi:hypothetical protein
MMRHFRSVFFQPVCDTVCPVRRTVRQLCAAALIVAPLVSPQDAEKPAFWRLVERVFEERGLEEPAGVVLQHMSGVPTARATTKNKLARIELGLREPWRVPELASELAQALSEPVEGSSERALEELAAGASGWLELDLEALRDDPGLGELEEQWELLASEELRGEELLEALSIFVSTAHVVLEESLAGMSAENREMLFREHPAFCESWYRSHMPDNRAEEQASEEQNELYERFKAGPLEGDGRDAARACAVASVLLRLCRPEFLDGLPTRLKELSARVKSDGFEGDVRAVVGEASCERVVLGGTRPTHYHAPAALVVDLGGNDDYARAAVVDSPEMLVSIVLDLKGDDEYASESPGPAYAVGGVSILLDRRGKDSYRSARLGQGAAALGFALLADLDGDDRYELHDYGQGHGMGAGVGLLVDREGDDVYEAWAYAQGASLAGAFAALVDADGDDRYTADGVWPDVYGNSGPDCYHGASQGYATGLRTRLAGGVAALVDLGEGEDRYQSGNFSQGGGYYFSFGLMLDGGGDDENFGSRYSQGFGVHQAIGVRWDRGGDDRYTCRSVAHAGMAWDEGVGYLLEDGGDDLYRVGGLALGGAAQTGVAVLLERGGKDDYGSGGQSQGGTGSSEYHDKPSIGVLIDLGGQKDAYSEPGRENGSLRADEGVAVFLDHAAKTVEQALEARKL